MDLDQDIQVINPKDNNVSLKEKHKWRMQELPPVPKGTSPTDKSLVEKPKHVVRGPEEEAGPRKGEQPSGSSPSLHKQKSSSISAKEGQENTKEQSEGQEKGKIQAEQALPTELQNLQEGEDSHVQCIQYGKDSDGIQKQG
ncbi:hypothetical protein O181_074057 [Austropuccinia psidii MF-1]|uniref:Uncharacterized protein n=1 Tax=Austropuccinia psidii MF-1 TaxID=1389203 RepID=A0A9Q3IBL7_9BASI|nr:hypothetical protein [Austropuccinia psidii MF-1]